MKVHGDLIDGQSRTRIDPSAEENRYGVASDEVERYAGRERRTNIQVPSRACATLQRRKDHVPGHQRHARAAGRVTVWLSGFALIAAAACACAPQPARIAQTASGRPEVVVRASLDAVKAALISNRVDVGYMVERDTPYLLEVIRPCTGAENVGTAFATGTGFSSCEFLVSYTFAPVQAGVRVAASTAYRSHAYGKTQTTPSQMTNQSFNDLQQHLETAKQLLEGAPPGSP